MTPRIAKTLWLAATTLLLTACAFSPIGEFEGESLYTQRNLWVTDGVHETTNYRVEYMIPVNTRVRIGDTNERVIKVSVPETGERFRIINMRQYTDQDIKAIFHRYFADQRRNLDAFSADEREAIEAGEIERGMSKDAVLVARGFPPAHETPSIRMDEWRYWNSGNDTRVVRFDGDRVSAVVD
ncbi:MAG: hypothetical protein U5K73_12165 [Halofilum sp. (in: g-proteobacteria)]|nr:hypothetical protein [Halofilum sp. (in: g-proteobacteria)]